MATQHLTRSNSDKIIAGVCGGLANYFGIDPVIVRLLAVILFFAGGISILLYPVLWLVMPREGSVQPSMSQTVSEMAQQAQQIGQQTASRVQHAFATPRYDPQTGQPLSVDTTRRHRTLGLVLVGVGVMMLASYFGSGHLALALMVIGGGVYLLRNRQVV